jgi:hypothetical protein
LISLVKNAEVPRLCPGIKTQFKSLQKHYIIDKLSIPSAAKLETIEKRDIRGKQGQGGQSIQILRTYRSREIAEIGFCIFGWIIIDDCLGLEFLEAKGNNSPGSIPVTLWAERPVLLCHGAFVNLSDISSLHFFSAVDVQIPCPIHFGTQSLEQICHERP